MQRLNLEHLANEFSDDNSCLEWLKNQLFPDGIECHVCKRVTKHHILSKRKCYTCDKCGNHVYPTVGTIFYKSRIPLKTWFEIIYRMYDTNCGLSAKEIQRQYGLTYKTSLRIAKKIKELIHINKSQLVTKVLDNYNILDRDKIIVEINKQKNNKRRHFSRSDRTARLLKLQTLLSNYSKGLYVKEIASRYGISKRTVYRDLRTLELELGVPIWEENGKRGIIEGYFLPPIHFSLAEATSMFLAIRLIWNCFSLHNPSLVSAFMKLNTTVPNPLKKQIQNTLEYIERLPRDESRDRKFGSIMQAWLSQHSLKIRYQSGDHERNQTVDTDQSEERIIDPYFIETSTIGNSIYIIAFCHLKNSIDAFRFERIIGDVEITSDTFEIPGDFDAVAYLAEAWGIYFNKDIEVVKLRFTPKMSRLIRYIRVHPSQTVETQMDGSIIMSLKVRDNINFRAWILGWGDDVEVLEPQTLRDQICGIGKSLVNIYSLNKNGSRGP